MSLYIKIYRFILPQAIQNIITRIRYSECRSWSSFVKEFGLLRGTIIFISLHRDSRVCQLSVPGVLGKILIRPNTSDVGIFQEIFLDHLYSPPAGLHPKCIIDGGANIGLTSVYFAQCFPDALIISIEPESSNFAMLSENVRRYSNIHVIKAALWSKKCHLKLSNPDNLNCAFRVEPEAMGEVETITLDDLFNLAPNGKIDILKIDIEGAEREFLSNRDARLKNVECVMIELHERFAPGCESVFRNAFSGMDFIEYAQGDNIILTRQTQE